MKMIEKIKKRFFGDEKRREEKRSSSMDGSVFGQLHHLFGLIGGGKFLLRIVSLSRGRNGLG